MGSWACGPFDNDAATRLYLELIGTRDLSPLEEVLDTKIVANEFFDVSDMELIEAACEVVLGLLAPEEFERRSNAGPKHVEPLADGLDATRDLQERYLRERPAMNYSIPSRLVDWVKQHRHLDPRPLLGSANAIVNHARARGEAFYHGCLFNEADARVWLNYIDDLHGRIEKAMQA